MLVIASFFRIKINVKRQFRIGDLYQVLDDGVLLGVWKPIFYASIKFMTKFKNMD